MSNKIKVKAKFAPPKLALALAVIRQAVPNERKKGFELIIATQESDDLRLAVPEPLDPDGPLGQQIKSVLGRDISDGFDLGDLANKKAFVLLVPRRSSGGKFHHSVEAILATDVVLTAAKTLSENDNTQESTTFTQ